MTIGGGKTFKGKTVRIDQEIIRLSGKKHPRLLFIPTASSDSEEYWQFIQKYFGKKLGCNLDVLWLIKEKPSFKEIKAKILKAEIVYVGGGNTLAMMRRWRLLGVDKVLRQALRQGVILSGVSAGSVCWYESGHSDSMSFYNKKKWKYINVTGLGFIKGIHCPHYDSQTLGVKRKKNFEAMIQARGGFGIVLDDCCALEVVGKKYRVLTSARGAHAYRVYKKDGRVISESILEEKVFRPLAELYRKNTI